MVHQMVEILNDAGPEERRELVEELRTVLEIFEPREDLKLFLCRN